MIADVLEVYIKGTLRDGKRMNIYDKKCGKKDAMGGRKNNEEKGYKKL